MKRTLLAISLCLVATVCGRAATIINITPAMTTLPNGSPVTLTVQLSTDASIFGFQFDLMYPTFLSLNSIDVTELGFFAANGCCFSFDMPDNSTGVVTNVLDAISGPTGFTGAGALVSFKFFTTGTGTGTVSLQNILLTDDSLNTITPDSVGSAGVTSTPTPTPEPSMAIPLMAAGLALLIWRRTRESGIRQRL